MKKIFNVGVIGCGNISDIYFINSRFFKDFNIVACSDINHEIAQEKAKKYEIKAVSTDEIFQDPDIDIVLNLTIPAAHFDISKKALLVGKHVYSEKPIVLSSNELQELEKIAKEKDLYICSAPDTFLGPTHQYVKDLFKRKNDNILSGTVHLLGRGMEHWHPNPEFFYKEGGGPILDMGPYYISLLTYLLGPVKSVFSHGKIGIKERIVTAEENYGKKVQVETPTTFLTLLEFETGTHISMVMSWDVWNHQHNRIELYGEKASYILADPNHFGGKIHISDNRETFEQLNDIPTMILDNGKEELNLRGIGISEMCHAIAENREAQCGLAFAGHCFAVLEAILESAKQKKEITVSPTKFNARALSFEETKNLLNI